MNTAAPRGPERRALVAWMPWRGRSVALAPVPAQRRRLLTTQALPPPELEARVDTFLAGFRATLAAMPEAELGAYREALAVQVSDVDKRLAQQVRRRPIGTLWHPSRHLFAPLRIAGRRPCRGEAATPLWGRLSPHAPRPPLRPHLHVHAPRVQVGRFWSEVVQRRYDYERPWRLAAQVRQITRAQLLAFFDTYLAPDGAERRRLATHVYSSRAAPRQLVIDAVSEVDGAEPLYYPPPTWGSADK